MKILQSGKNNLSWEHHLILGNQPRGPSLGEYRKRLLIGEIAVLSFLFNIFYLILDLVTVSNSTVFIYILNIGLFSYVFYTNRIGKVETAKIILLYSVLISIYLFGSNNVQNTETYLLYLPLILLAFTINGYEGRHFSISFSVVSLFLYFLDVYTEFSIFPPIYLSSKGLKLMTTVNFLFSLTGMIYLAFFLTKTHYLSEKKLLIRQKKLNKLTDDLKSSQLRYKLAMTGTNAGLWDWDLVRNRIFHGPTWNKMLGYAEDELRDMKIDEIYEMIHPEDIDKVKEAVRDHLERNTPYELEYRIRKKNGEYAWFYDSGKAILGSSEKPIRMVGSIINVTKRKLAEDKIIKQKNLLEKTNAELDRFLYITSHDLKAPLLSIQGLIHLAEISEDKTEIEMCLKMMKERITGLQNFISDIIDYSRNVKVGIVNDEIILKKLVESICKEVIFLDETDNVDFQIDIHDELRLMSDEKRVNVVMKNLILNAIKYRDPQRDQPFIRVSARENGMYMLISVEDNGEGIDPDIQDKIYDMFYRASERSSGSGLGLYIVREMLQKLEGTIELRSKPGEGSEFTVKLPIRV